MTTTSPTARDAWPLLLARLDHARAATDSLFGLLRDEAFYDRTIAERHRIGFYRGHLDAFDWNLLNGRLFKRESVNPGHDHLFAFGIDPIDGQLPSDEVSDWPLRVEVEQYCWSVRDIIDEELRRVGQSGEVTRADSPAVLLLNVAIEHRLMHAETLAYLLHQLPLDRKVQGQPSQVQDAAPVESAMIEVPAGRTRLGMPAEPGAASFGWCNEFDGADVDVPAFAIDKYMVSNGEFLAFVDAGGYDNRALWSDADWVWRTQAEINHPVFWRRSADSRWRLVTMFDEIDLPLNWPVYVSHAEASAYARWAGKALPSEAQWQLAAGSRRPHHGNFDFAYFDPVSVDADLHERSESGAVGMWGNGWEWTSTVFGPLPGFKAYECYPGYSANFFDGQHYVLKGGSTRTASCMIRPSFRNWFQPRYQYVYAGFRCVSA